MIPRFCDSRSHLRLFVKIGQPHRYACRDTHYHCCLRHVLRDHRICCDNRIVPDIHAPLDESILSDPDVIPNGNRTHFIRGSGRADTSASGLQGMTVVVKYSHPWRYQAAVADRYLFCRPNRAVGPKPRVIPDFNDALRELEGTFIRIQKHKSDTTISFHNPSILDFLTSRISQSESDLRDLLAGCVYFDQLTKVVTLLARGSALEEAREHLSPHGHGIEAAFDRTIESPSMRVTKVYRGNSEDYDLRTAGRSIARRLTFGIELGSAVASEQLQSLVVTRIEEFVTGVEIGASSAGQLVALLEAAESTPWIPSGVFGRWLEQTKPCLLDRPDDRDDIKPVVDWMRNHPAVYEEADSDQFFDAVQEFISEEVDRYLYSEDDVDQVECFRSELDSLAAEVDLDVSNELEWLSDRIHELSPAGEEYYGEGGEWSRLSEPSKDASVDLDGMFDSLRSQ